MKPDTMNPRLKNPPDFPLVLGGPLYHLLRRAHLSGETLEFMSLRVTVLALVAWLPLLVLSIIEGRAWGVGVKMPFLMDVDVHTRFLLALPLFIVAEQIVHRHMSMVPGRFLNRGLVPDEARGQFNAAIDSAMRLRNSVLAEILMLAFVYGIGVLVIWRNRAAMDVSAWYRTAASGELEPTLAGWWLVCVSLPLLQFILLRWYFRMFIWGRFLWHVSRIELRLVPTHPDRAGSLGFLSAATYGFQPILAGQGVLLSGVIANRIFHTGAMLPDFRVELVGWLAMLLFCVLAPMLVFVPLLARTKRTGLVEYGELAQRYVSEFDKKWCLGGAQADEPLLGSADIQSLADLGNSYEVVKGMKWVPFSKELVLKLALVSLAPVAPLVLTAIPLEELLDRLLKVIF